MSPRRCLPYPGRCLPALNTRFGAGGARGHEPTVGGMAWAHGPPGLPARGFPFKTAGATPPGGIDLPASVARSQVMRPSA